MSAKILMARTKERDKYLNNTLCGTLLKYLTSLDRLSPWRPYGRMALRCSVLMKQAWVPLEVGCSPIGHLSYLNLNGSVVFIPKFWEMIQFGKQLLLIVASTTKYVDRKTVFPYSYTSRYVQKYYAN